MRRRIRRGAFGVPVLLGLLGFGLGSAGAALRLPDAPSATVDAADCLRIRESRKKRRKCFKAIAEGELQDAQLQLARLPEDAKPVDRDLVRLRVAAESPRLAPTLCQDVETPEAERLCNRLVGRPHLYATDGEWVLRDQARGINQSERKGRNRGDERGGERQGWRRGKDE